MSHRAAQPRRNHPIPPFLNRDSSRVGIVIAAGFAAAAINSAYLPLWFADHGLTASEIGQVVGAASLLRVVGGPLAGWVADRLGRPQAVVAAAAGIAALSAMALPGLHGFLPLLVAAALLGVGSALISPLTDAVALALAAARRLDYGRTRAWGSIAYMAATAGAGALLTRGGSGVVPGLLAGGYLAASLLALRLPAGARLPRRGGGALSVLHDRGFRLALLATALIQGSHAAYYSFAPLHWRAAGLSDTTIGLLIAEGVVAEVALFLWGRRLIDRLGPARLTALAALACILRWSALAFVTAVPALAVLQLLHAATFAFQHLSTMLVLRTLPPDRAGMAQTLMSALGFSAATAALVWLTGQLYGTWHGLAFLPMALVGGVALLTVPSLARVMRIRLASAAG
jgi:PPP family 3-phenylpropionic acid transporter